MREGRRAEGDCEGDDEDDDEDGDEDDEDDDPDANTGPLIRNDAVGMLFAAGDQRDGLAGHAGGGGGGAGQSQAAKPGTVWEQVIGALSSGALHNSDLTASDWKRLVLSSNVRFGWNELMDIVKKMEGKPPVELIALLCHKTEKLEEQRLGGGDGHFSEDDGEGMDGAGGRGSVHHGERDDEEHEDGGRGDEESDDEESDDEESDDEERDDEERDAASGGSDSERRHCSVAGDGCGDGDGEADRNVNRGDRRDGGSGDDDREGDSGDKRNYSDSDDEDCRGDEGRSGGGGEEHGLGKFRVSDGDGGRVGCAGGHGDKRSD